ncbi:citrate-Mg2+:H+ or citrate-Ca2+:H+ symporter, CitMHS family [Gilliamella bombicola]|uniref:Citrate-Mg2+:H+ or citrate-Ca2+:H+ symporter, CitMHS family n=1 Tax=Gilliamella bombicola TaxID=1798182 RepID=A0A1C4C3S4_9GAMM|nr:MULTISPECIES: citrate:proton symporter [Gilliamella]NUF28150.1 citrate transporter [Gilliamella sp. ESL0254]SCC13718.1 citrate-Mg2+:H+ or citrate-Ca2+:H+ symporter, CitMHS family [Gilliamella bombicola]
MLALTGILTIVVMLYCIMSKRMSPIVALIIIPTIGALIAGSGLETPKYIVAGITKLAPMAAMFVFAITFFGVITDAGMFDPIIKRILRFVGTNPIRIIIGTGILALIAHLDGNGAVTFLVTIPTMLPLFTKLGMDKRMLIGITALSAGVNFLPWTGPMIRAASALNISTHDLFVPLIPAQIVGLTFMIFMGYYWGKKEQKRLGLTKEGMLANSNVSHHEKELTEEEKKLRRPHLFWVNIGLVVAVLSTMVFTRISPTVAFMIALTLALMINYPNVKMQSERINAHAKAALMMASILFAAGAFTGIMTGSGMLKAMSESAVNFIPQHFASHVPFITGIVSMPLSLIFDPDSYYFGIMPVVANTVEMLGIPSIQVAQASIMGQMTTGFPVSPLTPATFLLVSLAGVDLADHQKFSIPVLWLASIIMTVACVVTGVFPI